MLVPKAYWELTDLDEVFRAGYQARLDNQPMASAFDPRASKAIRDEYDKGYRAANRDLYLEDGAFIDHEEPDRLYIGRSLEIVQWLF